MNRRTALLLGVVALFLISQQKLMSNQEVAEREADGPLEFYDAGLARKYLTPDKRGDIDELFSDKLNDISIVKLIANPKRYHQKAVRFQGYFRQGNEESGVYLSAESANYLDVRSGVWVSFGNPDVWTQKKMNPQMFSKKTHCNRRNFQ